MVLWGTMPPRVCFFVKLQSSGLDIAIDYGFIECYAFYGAVLLCFLEYSTQWSSRHGVLGPAPPACG
ncbi:hypothetical protein K440DRAFT_13414 [Wilcoxina mikolae CBS 423.85]|nr:hypothetical protein K440DRAFT_13414 [Wilcoxina mikolae CBS 423.85]